MSCGARPLDQPVGFRAKRHAGLIDVDKKAACDVRDYWEPIWAEGELVLDPDQFYILASKEAVSACPRPMRRKWFRSIPWWASSGFTMPDFSTPASAMCPAAAKARGPCWRCAATRCPLSLEDGQIIGRLIYERLATAPDQVYGQGIGSNYQRQGLKLSKHFKDYDPSSL